ncbi:hypothetical protein BDP81DRAFT_456161 [Colletotrichum phormii]|uniref:Uncharacterized protein n=1 Tax=Colletotrichum phormii TaxID=359342 RepID=A0AAJ0E7A1_9PEZI|nr:uncharacterized protein BDP81DRAFT_456161 [Colletotrichum phormii]KAK1621509.1 hypothetical protein BDP81DRAFT_456161 [Colletotrichum phormii]
MPKRRRTNVDTYDFDTSFAAEVESNDYDDDDDVSIRRIKERRKVEAFNGDPFAYQDYSPRTTVLLDTVEEQWRQYVLADFFYYILKRDPKDYYAKMSLSLMYNFFN